MGNDFLHSMHMWPQKCFYGTCLFLFHLNIIQLIIIPHCAYSNICTYTTRLYSLNDLIKLDFCCCFIVNSLTSKSFLMCGIEIYLLQCMMAQLLKYWFTESMLIKSSKSGILYGSGGKVYRNWKHWFNFIHQNLIEFCHIVRVQSNAINIVPYLHEWISKMAFIASNIMLQSIFDEFNNKIKI